MPFNLKGIPLVNRFVGWSCFEWCGLGNFKIFKAEPQGVFCLFDPRKPKLTGLLVQLWGTGSRAIFYKRSHQLACATPRAPNGLLEVPREALAVRAVERVEVDMEVGGL